MYWFKYFLPMLNIKKAWDKTPIVNLVKKFEKGKNLTEIKSDNLKENPSLLTSSRPLFCIANRPSHVILRC